MPSESRTVCMSLKFETRTTVGTASPRLAVYHVPTKWLRARRRCRSGILTIELVNEGACDINPVINIDHRNLGGVNNHADAVSFGICRQRLINVVVERSHYFIMSFLVSSLSILASALILFFELFDLITLGANLIWSHRNGAALKFCYLVLKLLNPLGHLIQFFLARIE